MENAVGPLKHLSMSKTWWSHSKTTLKLGCGPRCMQHQQINSSCDCGCANWCPARFGQTLTFLLKNLEKLCHVNQHPGSSSQMTYKFLKHHEFMREHMCLSHWGCFQLQLGIYLSSPKCVVPIGIRWGKNCTCPTSIRNSMLEKPQ